MTQEHAQESLQGSSEQNRLVLTMFLSTTITFCMFE